MKPIPTDFEILSAIYERHYDAFTNYSEESPSRSSKIYVPIDITAIAEQLGVDEDIVFGRLYYHLEKKYGYTRDNGAMVALFTPQAGAGRNCINFPLLSAVLAEMRSDPRNKTEGIQMSDLDPFRAVLGVIESSDTLIAVASAAGLRFDMTLTDKENYSHSTRVRALLPRVVAAYDRLSAQDKLIAANAVVAALVRSAKETAERAGEALSRIGWELRGEDIVTGNSEVKEKFFPKGSSWDASVVIREIMAEAKTELLINDAYCDESVFHLLKTRKDLAKLRVRFLCSKYADRVAAEAKLFVRQHTGVTVEVRSARGDFHDRFIVIDGANCVHLGASIKDAGTTGFMLNRVEEAENRAKLIREMEASWANGAPVP